MPILHRRLKSPFGQGSDTLGDVLMESADRAPSGLDESSADVLAQADIPDWLRRRLPLGDTALVRWCTTARDRDVQQLLWVRDDLPPEAREALWPSLDGAALELALDGHEAAGETVCGWSKGRLREALTEMHTLRGTQWRHAPAPIALVLACKLPVPALGLVARAAGEDPAVATVVRARLCGLHLPTSVPGRFSMASRVVNLLRYDWPQDVRDSLAWWCTRHLDQLVLDAEASKNQEFSQGVIVALRLVPDVMAGRRPGTSIEWATLDTAPPRIVVSRAVVDAVCRNDAVLLDNWLQEVSPLAPITLGHKQGSMLRPVFLVPLDALITLDQASLMKLLTLMDPDTMVEVLRHRPICDDEFGDAVIDAMKRELRAPSSEIKTYPQFAALDATWRSKALQHPSLAVQVLRTGELTMDEALGVIPAALVLRHHHEPARVINEVMSLLDHRRDALEVMMSLHGSGLTLKDACATALAAVR